MAVAMSKLCSPVTLATLAALTVSTPDALAAPRPRSAGAAPKAKASV